MTSRRGSSSSSFFICSGEKMSGDSSSSGRGVHEVNVTRFLTENWAIGDMCYLKPYSGLVKIM